HTTLFRSTSSSLCCRPTTGHVRGHTHSHDTQHDVKDCGKGRDTTSQQPAKRALPRDRRNTPGHEGPAKQRSQQKNSGPLSSTDRTAVELRGLEPLTSSLPVRRATNCAIAPCGASAPLAMTTVQHCRRPDATGGADHAVPLSPLFLAAEQILEPVGVPQCAEDLTLVRHHRSAEPSFAAIGATLEIRIVQYIFYRGCELFFVLHLVISTGIYV